MPLESCMTPSPNGSFLYHRILMTIFGCTAARSFGTSSDVQKRARLPLYWKLVSPLLSEEARSSHPSISLPLAAPELTVPLAQTAVFCDVNYGMCTHTLPMIWRFDDGESRFQSSVSQRPLKRTPRMSKTQPPHHQRRQQAGYMEPRRIQNTCNRGIKAGYHPIM